jgi:hypothetical protein
MRLRFVKTCHFGKSELTNFAEILAKHPEFADPESKHRLKLDDVVLLVAMSGNQLVFLHGFDTFSEENGAKHKVLRSTRFRLPNKQQWNPLMLANYSKSVGIVLTGLTEYEQHVKKHIKE